MSLLLTELLNLISFVELHGQESYNENTPKGMYYFLIFTHIENKLRDIVRGMDDQYN